MSPNIYILGKEIPLYGLAFYTGILMSAVAAFLLMRKRRNFPMYDLLCSAIYTMIGALLGSKLLFLAVTLPEIIQYQLPWYSWIKGGFVFYGGLIGGIAGLFLYTKQFRFRMIDFVDIYAAVLPLGHSIGRIGCFFAGCCYGLPYNGPGAVIYHESSSNIPLGTPLFPIQLVEAALLLALFVLLAIFYVKSTHQGNVAVLYIICYSVMRFILEFFRGDSGRGKWLFLSTSQWVSIGLITALLIILALKKAKNKAEEKG